MAYQVYDLKKKNENLDAENDQINYNVGKPEVE